MSAKPHAVPGGKNVLVEFEGGIASLETNVADHLNWAQNPTAKVSDFFFRSAEYQAGLLNKWRNDAIRNASQANILRQLLKELP